MAEPTVQDLTSLLMRMSQEAVSYRAAITVLEREKAELNSLLAAEADGVAAFDWNPDEEAGDASLPA
jgi:hypothetical protein